MWSLHSANIKVHDRVSQNCREDTGNSKDRWGGKLRSDVLVELECEEASSGPLAALLPGFEVFRKVLRKNSSSYDSH